jgi:hypothetical protein
MEHDCTRRCSAPGPVKSASASTSGAATVAFLAPAAPSPPPAAAALIEEEDDDERRSGRSGGGDGGGTARRSSVGGRRKGVAAAAVHRPSRVRWWRARRLMCVPRRTAGDGVAIFERFEAFGREREREAQGARCVCVCVGVYVCLALEVGAQKDAAPAFSFPRRASSSSAAPPLAPARTTAAARSQKPLGGAFVPCTHPSKTQQQHHASSSTQRSRIDLLTNARLPLELGDKRRRRRRRPFFDLPFSLILSRARPCPLFQPARDSSTISSSSREPWSVRPLVRSSSARAAASDAKATKQTTPPPRLSRRPPRSGRVLSPLLGAPPAHTDAHWIQPLGRGRGTRGAQVR